MKRKASPWFRVPADFLSNPRMLALSFDNQRHFIGVLALECDSALDVDCDPAILDRIVAQRLWIDPTQIASVKAALIGARLIADDWRPIDWASHQRNTGRLPSHIWRAIREAVFKRDDYICRYCGERGKKLECDHIVPVALGGSHEQSNLATACFPCNRSKRDKTLAEWRGA